MKPNTLGLICALLSLSAQASDPTCGTCSAGAQCIAGKCQFICESDENCHAGNVCLETQGRKVCEPRVPNQRQGEPAVIRRGDEKYPERYKLSTPIPAGFHVAGGPSWSAVGGGIVAFSCAWLPVAIVGLATQTPLRAIPFAGPILGFRPDTGPSAGFLNVVFVVGITIDVLVQVVGVGMIVGGIVAPKRWLERDVGKPTVSFAPGAPGAPIGGSLLGRF